MMMVGVIAGSSLLFLLVILAIVLVSITMRKKRRNQENVIQAREANVGLAITTVKSIEEVPIGDNDSEGIYSELGGSDDYEIPECVKGKEVEEKIDQVDGVEEI